MTDSERSAWSQRYEWGAAFEGQLCAWLLATRRYAVVRVANGQNWVPALDLWRASIVLPDLQVHDLRTGRMFWLEAKLKTQSVEWRHAREERTGIDQRLHAMYLQIEAVTGHAVAIAFAHERSNVVWRAWAAKDHIRGVGHGSTMVYWPVRRLARVAALTEIREHESARGLWTGQALFAPPSTQRPLWTDDGA